MLKKILVVDDNKVDRVVLSGILKKYYEITEAVSGEQAYEILLKMYKDISAIILDIVMPGMDGYDTIKKIRENQIFQRIPIIIATSLEDDKSRAKAIAYGASGFITKPYNPALLLHSVQNSIEMCDTAAIANSLWRDSLTGLLKRESFFFEAEKMIDAHETGYYMLSCFDIENFKIINDQYGLEKGDEVLKYVAKSLKDCCTEISGICCRVASDNFAILYPAAIANDEVIIGNHRVVTSPDCINRKIKVRIGRYKVDDKALSVSAMFDRATMAAETVRGKYDIYIAEYSDSMRAEILREQQIVNDMNRALKAGEFVPWFQPQYNHDTGALIGAEVLVRWKKGDTYISPAEFIPVFERNGFIYEMDKSIW